MSLPTERYQTKIVPIQGLSWKMTFGICGLCIAVFLVLAPRNSSSSDAIAPSSAPDVAAEPVPSAPPASPAETASASSSDLDLMAVALDPSKASLFASLKDGDSAKVRDVTGVKVALDGTTVYAFCGEVNAKNSYGAYGGYERFVAGPNIAGTAETVEGFGSVWERFCDGGKVIMRNVPF